MSLRRIKKISRKQLSKKLEFLERAKKDILIVFWRPSLRETVIIRDWILKNLQDKISADVIFVEEPYFKKGATFKKENNILDESGEIADSLGIQALPGFVYFSEKDEPLFQGYSVESWSKLLHLLESMGEKIGNTWPQLEAFSNYSEEFHLDLGILGKGSNNEHHHTIEKENIFTEEKVCRLGEYCLHGHFSIGPKSIIHNKSAHGEYLKHRYKGRYVDLVAEAKKPVRSEIMLDSHPIPEDMAGEDVEYDKYGRSFINVKDFRSYNLIDSEIAHESTIKIFTPEKNFEIFGLRIEL